MEENKAKNDALAVLETTIEDTIDNLWQAAIIVEDGDFQPAALSFFHKKL